MWGLLGEAYKREQRARGKDPFKEWSTRDDPSLQKKRKQQTIKDYGSKRR